MSTGRPTEGGHSPLPDGSKAKRKRSLSDEEVVCLTALEGTVSHPSPASQEYHVVKVISGGQSGADRAALVAAKALGIGTGGWLPRGFCTRQGHDITLRDEYGLQEVPSRGPRISVARAFVERSMRNVDDADVTIAFRLIASPGTDKTIGYALTGKWVQGQHLNILQARKPCLVIRSVSEREDDESVAAIVQFILLHRPKIINVAGHRASKAPADFPSRVEAILRRALRRFT